MITAPTSGPLKLLKEKGAVQKQIRLLKGHRSKNIPIENQKKIKALEVRKTKLDTLSNPHKNKKKKVKPPQKSILKSATRRLKTITKVNKKKK